MNPRLAWENICLLTGGETAHHKTNINMAMKLESGELASNAKENMSIFSMHFHKVLNNNTPVDDSVLDLIEQKPCLTAIDTPITFREVKNAINKLKKGKAAGLNGIPPEALKAMDDTTSMFQTSLMERPTTKDGTKVNVYQYQCPRKVT